MTLLSQDRKTDKLGTEDVVYPGLVRYPVEASTTIYAGALVAINASGNAIPCPSTLSSTTGALKCVGRAERQVANQATGGTISPDGIATGAAGSIGVHVRQGVFYFNINADSTITKANFGANVYASDDNTVSLTDGGGQRPYVGYIVDPAGAMAPSPLSTQVGVMVGVANPYAQNPELAILPSQFKARGVVTSLQAYTGSGTQTLTETANGAWAAQDGITNAVGDIVFIQAGTTNLTAALDSGPWQITSLGSAGTKWTLTRPDWWTNGAVMPNGAVIEMGGEGTLFGGTSWKSFAAIGSAVIGTNDPAFYVGRVTQTATLAAGTVTVSNVGVRSLSKSQFQASLNTSGGTLTGTVGYGVLPNVTALTAGYIGTASIAFKAIATADAVQSSDTSIINVTITNW